MRALALVSLTLLASACAPLPPAAPPPAAPPPPPVVATTVNEVEPLLPANWTGMQWMYGSGESAASSLQTYRALVSHVRAGVAKRPSHGMVLADQGNLTTQAMMPCGDKPFAVILDADETLIQNLGYEYALAERGLTSGGPLLLEWQSKDRKAAKAMPGAIEAVNALREMGVTVIANSNRNTDNTDGTAATLKSAGLGDFVSGETLFLRGDVDGARGKDGRRSHVGSKYCVLALAGDQLADFADDFNDRERSIEARRSLAESFSPLWGNGWFLFSNPVYGPGLNGDLDEIFPDGARWNGED